MYEKFEKLLKEKNLSTYRVSKDTGITSSTFVISDFRIYILPLISYIVNVFYYDFRTL